MPDDVRSTTDQLTLTNPVTRYPAISPPEQHQPEPGLGSRLDPLDPRADIGEQSYRGTGRLVGRRALITGGASGIGAAVAVAFAREGADVVIPHLPGEERDARRGVDLVAAEDRRGAAHAGDLSDPSICVDLVDRAADDLGGLDILVNNAGRQIVADDHESLSDEQIDATFQANIIQMFRTTRAALAHLPAGSASTP